MRIVRREAERTVDARLELLGDHVFEPVGLIVDGVDVQAERLREVELEEPVMADHLDGDALAGIAQPCAAVGLVFEQAERGKLLHHRRRRRGRHTLLACERSDRDALGSLLKLVDPLQVILDRLG
jgi:hypothetical protein